MRFLKEGCLLVIALLSFLLISLANGHGPQHGPDCVLSAEEKRDIVLEDGRTWFFTEVVRQKHGIQKIVNCAEEDDVISLQPGLALQPTKRIVIRRNLTIEGKRTLQRDAPDSRSTFRCPTDGLFLVQHASLALKGIVIANCRLSKADNVHGIIEIASCAGSSSGSYELRLSDVLFAKNENTGGSVGFYYHRPSCHTKLFVDNTVFRSNRYRNSSLFLGSNYFSNVTIIENDSTVRRRPPFFYFLPLSISILRNLTARNNNVLSLVTVYGGNISISDFLFENNRGHPMGLVFANASSLLLDSSLFRNNSCARDGSWEGVYTKEGKSRQTERELETCDLGSRLVAFSGHETDEVHLRVTETHFVENRGGLQGGAVYVSGKGVYATLSGCKFLRNLAKTGAAILVDGTQTLDVSDCLFENNTATVSGGAISVMTREKAVIVASNFTSNAGQHGGAIASFSGITVKQSRFSGNAATGSGGGLSVHYQTSAKHSDRRAVELYQCWFSGNQAGGPGGALHTRTDAHMRIRGCTFRGNNASVGGALSLFRAARNREWGILESTFNENHATVGGAVSLMDTTYLDPDPESDFECGESLYDNDSLNDDPAENASFVIFQRVNISGNSAALSGGGIFAENASMLIIDGQPVEESEHDIQCSDAGRAHVSAFESIRNNVIVSGGEENLASVSRGFCVTFHFSGVDGDAVLVGPEFNVTDWKSGDEFPILQIVMHDGFGNRKSQTKSVQLPEKTLLSQTDRVYDTFVAATLAATQNSAFPDRFLRNNLFQDVSSGKGEITVGSPYVKPGAYLLKLTVEGFETSGVVIRIDVRSCRVNEQSDLDGTFCTSCESNQYNFHPEDPGSRCKTCPHNADCGTNFVLPAKGYWNAFPCSDSVDRCVYDEACNLTESDLAEISDKDPSCEFSEESIQRFQSSQCEKQYTGVLCGSCKESAGRLATFECADCIPDPFAAMIVAGAAAVQLILALLSMKETLDAQDDKTLENRLDSMRRNRRARGPPESRRIRNKMEDEVSGPDESTSSNETGRSSKSIAGEVRKAKWRFLGTLKITTNFLQTVSVAASLDLSWNIPTLTLFKAWDSMGGNEVISLSFAVDCLLSGVPEAHRTMARQIIIVSLPETIALGISAYSFLKELKTDGDWMRLLRRIVLAHVVVGYNSYLLLVKIAIDAFNCISVHDGTSLEEVESTHLYWAPDTSVKCYEGNHMTYILTVSVSLLLFSIGFPTVLAASLMRSRRQDNLDSPWTLETMSFLFSTFEEQYTYWDCLILFRSAVVSAIAVFAYRLGGDLQGLFIAAVLVVALFVHTECSPFRHDLDYLNILGSLSHLVSFITFLCGVILNNQRFTGVVPKEILVTVLLISNIGLSAALFFFLGKSKFEVIKVELKILGIINDDEEKFRRVALAYAKHQFSLLCEKLRRMLSSDGRCVSSS